MSKVKLILLTALVGLIVSSLAVFFYGGRVGYNPSKLIDALPDNVDMQLTGVHFTEVNSDGREWRMEADVLHYFKATDMMVLDNVNATFFSKDGPMHVKGDKAYYEKDQKKVRLVGNIQAKDTKGRKLTTRELRFDLSNGMLLAPGFFKFISPKMNLNGYGLSIDTRENRLKVLSRANVLMNQSEKTM